METTRERRLWLLALVATALTTAGCGADDPASRDEFIVERTSSNGVDTVRTISGSHWGGAPLLVEDLSIGVETGGEAFLFGNITGAWESGDRIYVIDGQVPAVRAYDLRGNHLFDIGRAGQGPGEYVQPGGLVVMDDGRIVVADSMNARLSAYDLDGEFVEAWPLAAPKSALGLELGDDGVISTHSWSLDAQGMGVQAVGPGGQLGELRLPPTIDFVPPTVSATKGLAMVVPFAPAYTWAYAPGGQMIAGVGDEYRFEVHARDGEVMILERQTEPVPVHPEEAEFRADVASIALGQMAPGANVRAADVPRYKPAFSAFFPDRSGRVWVARRGRGRPDAQCLDFEEASRPALIQVSSLGSVSMLGKPGARNANEFAGRCWTDDRTFDLFDLTSGDFLGSVEAPEPGFRAPLFAQGDIVLAAVTDALGTVRLKRYRLQRD